MSRIAGTGTMWLGAGPRHADDTCDATLWLTFLFAPLLPLRRSRLELHPHRGNGISVRERGRTPLIAREIVSTYLFGWIIAPLLLAGPLVLAIPELGIVPGAWSKPWILGAAAWLVVAVLGLMEW